MNITKSNALNGKIVYLKREVRRNFELSEYYKTRHKMSELVANTRLKEINRLKAYIKQIRTANVQVPKNAILHPTYQACYESTMAYIKNSIANKVTYKDGDTIWTWATPSIGNGVGSEAVAWTIVHDLLGEIDIEFKETRVFA